MSRLSKIGAACLAAFGWTSGTSGVTASYLVVAGGGGGGSLRGGGGGAGGFLAATVSLNPTLTYTVTVGAGGTGGAGGSGAANPGASGTGSVFGIYSAAGGGGGGQNASNGSNGGSGGGAGFLGTGGTGNTPSTSPAQGTNGGAGATSAPPTRGGGGGGATSAGATGDASGNGGNGTASSISGSSITYAGGGGGGGQFSAGGAGTGGTGGGGAGSATADGTAGTVGLGGGGGGSGYNASSVSGIGGNGGSGIVIISYPAPQQFSGGVVTLSGGNVIHTFTTSGTLGPVTPITASYLVVAGGGSGGNGNASIRVYGGGGAGGLLSGSGLTIDPNSTYLVTVGAGAASQTTANTYGLQGSSSSFSMVSTTAVGGGAGAPSAFGGDGGSGGGGGMDGVVYSPGNGTSGQGNNGGTGTTTGGGGGGGAGAVGSNASGGTGGAGGIGVASSISGTSTYYAGGGGGGGASSNGAGGNGGGGSGSTAGTANTGGGGGGTATNITSGAGGSGVVIISYPGSTQLLAGGTVTIVGGNVIHTFKSTGYLAPIKYATNSLRFRSSANPYLNRTPTVAGNRRTWTWSAWIKRGDLSGAYNKYMFGATPSASVRDGIYFGTSQTMSVFANDGSSALLVTSQVFRDPAAWYHLVVAVDTTQATSTNRIKVYVNGVQITSFSTSTYPSQNYDWAVNNTVRQVIGDDAASAPTGLYNFDGYMAEMNLIDGQQLTPNSFGTFNSYGVWQPINYGGSYGTNGFYLPFTNNTSTTTLGYDFSPNGNNWTPNNISVTAGVTYDSMTDVPTLTSATAANYCTLNPLDSTGGAYHTVYGGNLNWQTNTTGSYNSTGNTFGGVPSSGLWYYEFTVNQISAANVGYIYHQLANCYIWWTYQGLYQIVGSNGTTSIGLISNGAVIQVAVDSTNGKMWYGLNGTWYTISGTPNPAAGTGASSVFTPTSSPVYFTIQGRTGNAVQDISFNYGQRAFAYTPPTGFVAMNTYNL